MAKQKDTPKEGAEDWLNNLKPVCWVCKHDKWTFLGIMLAHVYPDGEGGPSNPANTARFVCNRCHVVFEVDCASAGIRSTPKQ